MTVQRGEIHAICGENGAGKSTLMKVLSGVWPAGTYDGEIHFNGQLVEFNNIRDSEHAGIVIIHQELALIPELSIGENIFLGNEVTHGGVINWMTTRQARERAARPGRAEREPRHQDQGHRRRQAAAGRDRQGAVQGRQAADPRRAHRRRSTRATPSTCSDLMAGLRSRGVTCIMISHKLNEIEQISDSITIIRDGKSIETLRVKEDGVDENRIIRGMVGRDLESRFPDHVPEIGEKLFEVKDWTVRHPNVADRLVCKSESFFVRRGEIVGFAGLMGAGRTELMRSIFGQSYGIFVSGTLLKDGQELHLKSVPAAIDAGLAYVTEDRKTLGLNLLDDIKRTTVSAKLKRITHGLVVDEREEYKYAEEYRKSMRTKAPTVDEGVVQALRRQPAEGGAGQVAVHRAGPADPRRAHPRHRRRRQVRDLRHRPADGRRG